jgi:hypothetical protein
MKNLHTILAMLAAAAPIAIAAEQPASRPQVPAQIQEMFKRIDRDGDGKLNPREMPNAERFKR